MTALDRLAVEDFAATLETSYRLELGADGSVTLTLVEATGAGELPPAPAAGADAAPPPRRPFSLLFRGPLDPQLRQATYRLRHAQLGDLEIFLVPVARRADGMRYEAVFG